MKNQMLSAIPANDIIPIIQNKRTKWHNCRLVKRQTIHTAIRWTRLRTRTPDRARAPTAACRTSAVWWCLVSRTQRPSWNQLNTSVSPTYRLGYQMCPVHV